MLDELRSFVREYLRRRNAVQFDSRWGEVDEIARALLDRIDGAATALQLDKDQIDRVEEDIAPPMQLAITIPVVGISAGVVVYVAATPFCETPPEQLRQAVVEVASRLVLDV